MRVLAVLTLAVTVHLTVQQGPGNFDINSLRNLFPAGFDFDGVFGNNLANSGNSGVGNPGNGNPRNTGTGTGTGTNPGGPRGPTVVTQAPNAQEIRRVKRVMSNLVTREPVWRARFIQLAFHDCVGGCDGCINLSDPANRGLPVTLNKAREIRRDSAPGWSQADVNALLGVAASEVSISARARSPSVAIPFARGRRDCANPNSAPLRSLPEGKILNTVEFLTKEFAINNREAVALMGGGHSIGQLHSEFSGMLDVSWDLSPTTLDHGYFFELARVGTWEPRRISNNLARTHMWTHVEDGTQLGMLHADMTMFKQFTISGPFDTPSCRFSQCANATTAGICGNFADDVNTFLRTYGAAFGKMITKGMN